MRRARYVSFVSVLVASIASGCSSSGTDDTSDPDAGIDGAAKTLTTNAAPVLSRALPFGAHHKDLRLALAPNADGLHAIDTGFASKGFRTRDPSHMAAVLPMHADASWRLGAGLVDRWSVKLAPVGARHAAAVEDEGRLAYEDAWESTDLVVTSATRGMEWLLLLRDEKAPTTFTWKMELGSDLRVDPVRLTDGSIDLVDGKGDAAVRIHPAFLVDAKGTRRDVRIDVVDGELRVIVDTSGLHFPILVDPIASVPIWQKLAGSAVGGLGNGRYSAGMAWLPGASALLEIGGMVYDPVGPPVGYKPSAEVKQWNGTAWSSYTSLPALRVNGAAVYSGSRVYLFGGSTDSVGHTPLGSMLQTAGPSTGWTTLCSTCGPSARDENQMASVGGQIVLFGGRSWNAGASRYDPLGDTWIMDVAGGASTFTSFAPSQAPVARHSGVFVGQPTGTQALLFGGQSAAQSYGDTWLWTKTGATTGKFECVCSCSTSTPPVGPCPQEPDPRRDAASAWDDNRKRFVVVGGFAQYGDGHADSRSCFDFDPSTKSWTMLCGESPLDGCGTLDQMDEASGGYDAVRRRVVVAGGSGSSISGDSTFSLYIRGGSCSSDSDCDTGHCVESTCCETASCPKCKTCASTTNPGVCTNIALGQPDTVNGCLACDGSGNCKKANGASCSTGTECASGNCVDSTCCSDTACGGGFSCASNDGTCKKVLGSTCANNNACASDHCTDGECCIVNKCPAGSHCDWGTSGICRKDNGQTCTADLECGSGHCVDGYCCNGACSSQCVACDIVPGTCTPVTGPVHGSRTACSSGTSSDCGAQCNGTDISACHFVGAAKSCGSASCTGGVATSVGTCDGAGGCSQTPSSCGAYTCGSTTCKTTCASDTDCATGYFCSSSNCVAKKTAGQACTAASQCSTAGCVNGVCCNTTSCAAGSTCNGASAPGTCTKINGQACTGGLQCGSGLCVDSVCCNSACSGQCQACNVTGSVGTCSNVVGAPVGSRPACSGSGTCGARCDGTSAAACSYPTSSTSCGSPTCTAGVATSAGTCDGAGTCNQPTASCGVYTCSGSVCRTSCTADTDCTSGYFCSAGACTAKRTTGTACTAANQCSSGYCVSGVCCGSSSCPTGSTCNGASSPGSCTKNNGQSCTTASECGSNLCVDGVCCNSACSGQCQACNVTGSVGTCSNVVGAPVGSRSACSGSGTCGARCDGTSAVSCNYPGATTSCGTASCTSGVETGAGTCNGSGSCNTTSKSCGAYTCGATSCKTTCATSADCGSGYYCKSGACSPKEADGASCTALGAASCASGNCVDGVCCSSSSCSGGAKCNVTGAAGKCAKPNGIACTGSTECGSGFCVDGVCCDTSCSSQCAACDVSGKVGTCSAVTGTPHGSRSACSGAGAGTQCGPVCNGTDMIACHYPIGTTSCGANTCTSSGGSYIETHVSVCDGGGACKDDPKTCGGYLCGSTACKSACATNSDCNVGYYCKSNACIPIEGLGTACTTASTCTSGFCTDGVCCALGSCGAGKSCSAGLTKGICTSLNGTSCVADSECASGACVDGVCCDSKCDGSCEACNKVGSVGKCVPIVGDPLTGHPPCGGTSTDASCAQRCDGTDGKACKYPGTTATCGAPSCGGGVETQVSTCDGAGSCKPATKACAPYVCGTTACLSSCTTNADCNDAYHCTSGTCVPDEGAGKACTSDAECNPISPETVGHCTDGVCCSKASCGDGASCAAADSATPGQCLLTKGTACASGSECASGHCVDGVCCDNACGGQCEACDVSGSVGTCTPVVTEPHSDATKTVRPACDTLDDKDCKKQQCDGVTRDKCVGFKNGATTECGTDSCTTDKRFQKHGSCDGKGGCAMPDPKPCTPFACDDKASSGCKSSCATDTDCADGFTCQEGTCIQGAKCSDDRLSSIDKAGVATACTPYRCGSDGNCLKSCGSSDDCAPGTACDTNVKACVVASGGTDDSGGGCAMGKGEGRSFASVLALLAFGWFRRRSNRVRSRAEDAT